MLQSKFAEDVFVIKKIYVNDAEIFRTFWEKELQQKKSKSLELKK